VLYGKLNLALQGCILKQDGRLGLVAGRDPTLLSPSWAFTRASCTLSLALFVPNPYHSCEGQKLLYFGHTLVPSVEMSRCGTFDPNSISTRLILAYSLASVTHTVPSSHRLFLPFQMKCVGSDNGKQPCERCKRQGLQCGSLFPIPLTAILSPSRRCIFETHRRGRKLGSKSVSVFSTAMSS
jgi:hypothetical protein